MATPTTRLALARRAAGYRQAEFAELVGLSPARLCEYEGGTRPPESRQADFAGELGYPVAALFPEELAVCDKDVRRWLAADHSIQRTEEPAAGPTPRGHADAGGGHDSR